jgi:hypothetical protein
MYVFPVSMNPTMFLTSESRVETLFGDVQIPIHNKVRAIVPLLHSGRRFLCTFCGIRMAFLNLAPAFLAGVGSNPTCNATNDQQEKDVT